MKRVLILGCAGAGKSTVARALSHVLGLPVVHLDRYYWRSVWIEADKAAWLDDVASLASAPCWIMDGNHLGTLPIRLAAADTVIYLDLPTWLCLARVLRRTARWFGRERGGDIPPGCPERLDLDFLRYVWRYRRDHRPRVLAALVPFQGRLCTPSTSREVRYLLNETCARMGTIVDATIIASASEENGDGRWVKHRGKRATHGIKAHIAAMRIRHWSRGSRSRRPI